jgi:hypothetical protein
MIESSQAKVPVFCAARRSFSAALALPQKSSAAMKPLAIRIRQKPIDFSSEAAFTPHPFERGASSNIMSVWIVF